MKNSIDIELSQKVAEQASVEITELKKTVEQNKDAHISLLSDVMSDMRDQRKFLKKISIFLCLMSVILTIGITVCTLHNQKVLKDIATDNVETMIKYLTAERNIRYMGESIDVGVDKDD